MPGSVSVLPGNKTVAFYPATEYVYKGEINVNVIYDGASIHRFNFKVRPLPTFVIGDAADSLMQPIVGLEVLLPDLDRTTTTSHQGGYKFGFGTRAEMALPGGRHRIILNPGRKNPLYGSIETSINLQAGRLTKLGATAVPILNPDIPFVHISSGQNPIILAAGDLTLDLTQATLLFPDGRNRGDVHTQFLPRSAIPYRGSPAVMPLSLYATQPQGIVISGQPKITIKMLPLYGSYDYLPADGTLVILVGFNFDTKQIIPIGIGEKQGGTIVSVGDVDITHLDYIGFTFKDANAQAILQQHKDGQISFETMVIELNRLASQ